jgi:hypothetical protein
MPSYVFDTDHLTLYQHDHPKLMSRVSQVPSADLGVSAVSLEEALRGRLAILSRPLTGPSATNPNWVPLASRANRFRHAHVG